MNNSKLVLLVMIVFTALTWYAVVDNQKKTTAEYNSCIEKAEKFVSKEIYIDAAHCYEEALKLNPKSYELHLKAFDVYNNLNDQKGMEDIYNRAIDVNSSKDQIYIEYINYLLSDFEYGDAVEIMQIAKENTNSDKIVELLNGMKGKFTESQLRYDSFEDIYNGYMRVKIGDKYGIADSDGNGLISCRYSDLGMYSTENSVVSCTTDGFWIFVDSNGNRKMVPDYEFEYLGMFNSGYASAKRKGKWGYIDTEFKEKKFEYDYAGEFGCGIAAVKKGDKWAIINTDFKEVVGFEYDDIILNDYGVCANYDLYFAKKNGKYALYNTKGKQVGSEQFDEACMFVSDQPAAVCQNGKWGFLNKDGKFDIKCSFDGAKSFCKGLAPVKVGEFWGFIDSAGDIRTNIDEDEFIDAYSISDNGTAIVEEEDGGKLVLKFYVLDN